MMPVDRTKAPVADAIGAPRVLEVSGRASAYASMASDGDFAVVVWAASVGRTTDIFAAVGSGGVESFGRPVRVNSLVGDATVGAERPPTVSIGRRNDRRVISVAWTAPVASGRGSTAIRLAESTDDARSFGASRTVHDPSLTGLRSWQSMAAAPDGPTHVSWLDGRDASDGDGTRTGHRSSPAGGAPRQDVFHTTLSPHGEPSERRVASNVCFCCKTATAVGRGAVYVAWRHIFPDSERDIALSRSLDGGRSFQAFTRVSRDRWKIDGCPDDGPSMAIDGKDRVHVAWPTVLGDPPQQKAVFYSFSGDGTEFSPRQRVDDSGRSPGHVAIGVEASGSVMVAWDDTVNGMRQVFLRRGDPAHVSAFGNIVVLGQGIPGADPALAPLARGALVAWTRGPSEASVIALQQVP
jgi:hypothetical protein